METFNGIAKVAVGIGIALTVSCAKQREAKLSVGAESQVFSIEELGGNDISKSLGTIQLSGDKAETLFADSSLALNDKPKYIINAEDSSVPSKMKYMLEGSTATGHAGQNFPIAVAIDDSNLTVYKMVDKVSELSVLECGLSLKRAQLDILLGLQFGKAQANSIQLFREMGNACEKTSEGMMIYVPLFKYKITAKGTLERKKNSLGEETAELVIKPSDIKVATHIQVAKGVDARLNAPFMDITNDETIAHVYVADKLIANATSTSKVHGVLCNGNFESNDNGKVISIPAKYVRIVMDINQNGKISETAKIVPANDGSSPMLSLDMQAAKQITNSNCSDSSAVPTVNPFKMVEGPRTSEQVKPAEPTKSEEQIKPVEGSKVPDSGKSIPEAKLEESGKSPEVEKNGKIEKPVDVVNLPEVGKTGDSVKPVDPKK